MNKEDLLRLGFIDELQYKEACAALNNPNARPHGMTGLKFGAVRERGNVCSSTSSIPSTGSYYASSGTYPSSCDLTPMMPPVYDQGVRGTCIAQAGTALMEYYYGGKQRLSQQFLYWIIKTLDDSLTGEKKLREWLSTNPRDSYSGFMEYIVDMYAPYEHELYSSPEEGYRDIFPGAQIFELERALREHGICDYDLMPYSTEFSFDSEAQSPELFDEALLERTMREPIMNARTRRLGDKLRIINGKSIDAYKKALSGAGGMKPMPVIVGVKLHKSLWTDYTLRTGWFSGSLAGDFPSGGHAMLVVGYCDAPLVPGGGYFIVRNSWGKTWAWDYKYPGYARIPYMVMAKDADTNALTIVESAESAAADDEDIWFDSEADPIESFIKTAERDMRNRFGKLAIARGRKIIVDPKTGKADNDTPANRAEFIENGYTWEK